MKDGHLRNTHDMNIVYLIGNGFDLKQGMRTKYEHFYDYYLSQAKDDDSPFVKMLKDDILKNKENWSDLELALGKYLGKLEENEAIMLHRHFIEHLSKYLEIEEDKSQLGKKHRDSFLDDLKYPLRIQEDPYKGLSPYENKKIEDHIIKYTERTTEIKIITFNYTESIERILRRSGISDPFRIGIRPIKVASLLLSANGFFYMSFVLLYFFLLYCSLFDRECFYVIPNSVIQYLIVPFIPMGFPFLYLFGQSVFEKDRKRRSIFLSAIEHIHGFTNTRMILGVNDKSQIASDKLREKPTITNRYVKSECNNTLDLGHDEKCQSWISEANLICLFGLSLGDTDKKWWDLIAKRTLSSDQCIVIFFENNPSKRFTDNQIVDIKEAKKEVIVRFLSKVDISGSEKEVVRQKMFVAYNTDMFELGHIKIDHQPSDSANICE